MTSKDANALILTILKSNMAAKKFKMAAKINLWQITPFNCDIINPVYYVMYPMSFVRHKQADTQILSL